MKNVVVTGVSTGIGRGAVTVLAGKGWHVFGSVRKEADARSLQQQLGDRFTPLVLDVEDDAAIIAAAELVRGKLWEKPYRAFIAWMIENGRKGLTPEQVAATIATALTAAKPKTRYEAVKGRFANATLPSLLPRRTVDRMIGRQLGLLPAKG